MKIVISHGSGGIGSAETFARDFFESKGYDVHLIDYFTPHGIKNLWWSDGDLQDAHRILYFQKSHGRRFQLSRFPRCRAILLFSFKA